MAKLYYDDEQQALICKRCTYYIYILYDDSGSIHPIFYLPICCMYT